jgi:AraC-like DNA-binding protein
MRDPLTAKRAAALCEQDMAQFFGGQESFASLVLSMLKRRGEAGSYFSLPALAQELQISPRTLTRKLEAEGCTFSALVEERRCEDAKELLSQPELRISDVAIKLGYADAANFTRAFRKWMGLTPSEYRDPKKDD